MNAFKGLVFTFFSGFFSTLICAKEIDSVNNIETLSVYGNTRIAAVDDVFTSDNILLFPAQEASLTRTVADVITQTAGVELNGQGGLLQSYNLRGFSRNRIKTEVNDIPIITDRRAGNSVSFIPAALIDSVYIQKGPSSSLYGSGAMGGVISLSTFSDENTLSIALQPNNGEVFNHQQVHAQYSNEYANFGGVYRQQNKQYSADTHLLNDAFEQVTFTASTQFNWHNIEVDTSLIYSDASNLGKSSSTFLVTRNSSYPQDKHILSQIKFSDGDTWKLQLFQHYQHWQSDVVRLENTQAINRNLTDYSSHTLGALATYALNDTTFGVEWYTRKNINIIEQAFNGDDKSLWQHPLVNADENNLGAYVNYYWGRDKLTVNLGARYDYLSIESTELEDRVKSSVDKNALSVSLSAQYAFTPNTYLNAEAASSFRFPTVSELLFSGETPRGNTQGNPELLSEKSKGYQLSIHHQLTPTLKGQVNTYLYQVENYIERVSLESGIRGYRNNDSVQIKGAELMATWQPSLQFNSSIGLQWQQGVNEHNQTIDDGLPAAIKWAWQWEPVSLYFSNILLTNHITYRFQKSRFGSSERLLNKAILWNSSFQYTLSNKSRVKLSLLNILNENYKASSDEDASFQPKRLLNIAFTWFY